MADSAEQKKKDARRKQRAKDRVRKAKEAKEKRRLAKVPPRYGGTAAPKPEATGIDLPYHRARAARRRKKQGQREIMGLSTPEDVKSKGIDTRAKWDVGRTRGGKYGQLRGGDIPLRTADIVAERARENPARGAHRGQSVGSRWDYSHGGKVDPPHPMDSYSDAEAFFKEQTTPNFVNRNKWVSEKATPDAKIVKKRPKTPKKPMRPKKVRPIPISKMKKPFPKKPKMPKKKLKR